MRASALFRLTISIDCREIADDEDILSKYTRYVTVDGASHSRSFIDNFNLREENSWPADSRLCVKSLKPISANS